jgi:hypothetical protein
MAKGGYRARSASSTAAAVLGALTLALTVLYVPLAYPVRDFGDGWQVLFGFLAFALPGVVVARRQPGNPIGWILDAVRTDLVAAAAAALEPTHVSVWMSDLR